MLVIDTIQYGPKSLNINLIVPLDEFCNIECSLNKFTQIMIDFNIIFYNQGLIWLQKPYYNQDTYTIETIFIIQKGMSKIT